MSALKMNTSQKLSREEIVNLLREVSLFSDLHENRAALEVLSHKIEERDYLPGTAIISEGESGSELYILTHGQASVYKSTSEGEPYKVAILTGANRAFFGEGGLLDSESRSATIKADTVCHCFILSRSALDSFGKENPNWALPILLKIARVVMDRLRKANTDLMLLYHALVSEIRGQ